MARGWVGPIEKLSDACRASRMLWALCLGCGHARKMDPRKIVVLTGELTIRDLVERLKCQRCGQKRSHVVPHDEEWPGR